MATPPSVPLAPYEVMPMPSLSDEQLDQILERHGLQPNGPIERLASSGVVHSLWALGQECVLRVPKNEAMCLGDHLCEAAAIPLALQAGVRTPDLVVFDDSQSILDVPYSIVTRVDGKDLGGDPFDHDAYTDVGRELARLHTADLDSTDPRLRDTSDLAADDLFDYVLTAGLLHRGAVDWLKDLCQRLDLIIQAGPEPPLVFIHGDIKPDNVMIDRAGAVHLIDWGDAGFGDPAHDFQSLPMQTIELVLAGYRAERPVDPTLEARIVRRVVARSLSNLCRSPLTGPSWYRPIAANLSDLLTFAIDHPTTWATWTSGPRAQP